MLLRGVLLNFSPTTLHSPSGTLGSIAISHRRKRPGKNAKFSTIKALVQCPKLLTKTKGSFLYGPSTPASLGRASPISLSIPHQPASALWIHAMEQPTLVRKPIKEPINISSLLTQKHSYRSFQAGAIRGQTSIRYGSRRFSYPTLPLRRPPPANSSRRQAFAVNFKTCHRRGSPSRRQRFPLPSH